MKLVQVVALSLVFSFSAMGIDAFELNEYKGEAATKLGMELLKLPKGEMSLTLREVDGGSLEGKAYYYSSYRWVLTDSSEILDKETGVVLSPGQTKALSSIAAYTPGVKIDQYGNFSVNGSSVTTPSVARDGLGNSMQLEVGEFVQGRSLAPKPASVSFGILVCLHRRAFWSRTYKTVACAEVPLSRLKAEEKVDVNLLNAQTDEVAMATLEFRKE